MIENPGYKLEHCRKNCTKAAQGWSELYQELEQTLNELNLMLTLEERFNTVNFHHIPKIVLAGCPNGCSQPQIRDIGISGYATPKITDNPCSGCQACINFCLEKALTWENEEVILDPTLCVSCGDCIRACSTGKIESGEVGWVFHLGGRLGRHPQLGRISGREHSKEAVIVRIKKILEDYIENGLPEERLSRFLSRHPF
jgi:dissimilatory sulfite reductase (desulfoviridin) alpha/beta subunit